VSGAVYQADPPEMRLAIPVEGMLLVYHRPSGVTHVLATPAPEILDSLAEGPGDAALLAARLGVADAPDADAIIAARLEEMAAAGLVWRA
jgi:PqqD family protein of HPr-rel-A system